MKILVVTVGGSHQPIVTAINSIKPDRVVFICSDGPKGSISQVIGNGKPCKIIEKGVIKEELPNIPILTGLGDRFDKEKDILLIEPDDLYECYSKIRKGLDDLKSENPDASYLADYTGGTKTMTAAFVLAALDLNIELFLTTGQRENIIKVERGESTEKISLSQITMERTMSVFFPELIDYYDYGTAALRIQNLLSSLELPKAQKKSLRALLNCCQSFDLWDRFEHRGALELIAPLLGCKMLLSSGLFLKRIISSRAILDESYDRSGCIQGHGFEVVEDLVLNSERRARQNRYDDALGRLYRAMELLGQIKLKKDYNILTGSINPDSLPPEILEKSRPRIDDKGILKFGLADSYELLMAFNDPIGTIYKERKSLILNSLNIRNKSLFAHGFTPISGKEYEEMGGVFISFINDAIRSVIGKNQCKPAVQFPRKLELNLFSAS